MELWCIVLICSLALAALCLLAYLLVLRHSLREAAEELDEKLRTDTNTLISISSGDRAMQSLVTHINRQLQALRRERLRLHSGNAELTAAFTNISHDLRTPLTSILAYARILNADDSLAPKTREAVGEIESNATLLLNMVNNILVISKHAAKKDKLLPEPVDFVDLAQFVRKALAPIAADKDVRLTCTVAPNVPLSMADWEKLRRILENLVNNAIKYTHRGGFVRLTIGFEDGETDSHSESEKADTNAPDDEDAAAGWIVMRVADDGMGIAPEELDQIFELYKQAGQSANRRYRGTGLGLAVVRDLTELHGGTVTVESRVKEGSTFTVRIPYVPVIEEEDEEA